MNNQSNYSNTRHLIMNELYWDPFRYGISASAGVNKVCKIDPKEYPFSVAGKDFKTRADAENYAKKRSGEMNDDVIISQRIAIVKFPVPDLKVEELVVS